MAHFEVSRNREVNAAAELRHATRILVENAREQRDGRFYEYMASIILTAFTFEAFLNRMGTRKLPFWDELERLPPAAKLNVLRTHLDIVKRDGERPYQTLEDLFRFRNSLAHGKDESLSQSAQVETGNAEEIRRRKPLTRWENLCTLEFAERAMDDTRVIMEEMVTQSGLNPSEFWSSGHGYSMKTLEEE